MKFSRLVSEVIWLVWPEMLLLRWTGWNFEAWAPQKSKLEISIPTGGHVTMTSSRRDIMDFQT